MYKESKTKNLLHFYLKKKKKYHMKVICQKLKVYWILF